ncbi:hypothetical protein BZL30_1441 [Mycobacterium kansasii]|uniref:Uncharacterized protein n=1 Tax=Mycobacterium kansasii TaxID=1768 RepID=A0A1V3XS29_MYCKA|nr:hypothetical protein BZL30_1441 [Mycobacterium kansasii]
MSPEDKAVTQLRWLTTFPRCGAVTTFVSGAASRLTGH